MDLHSIILLRHELLLTIAALGVLFADLFVPEDKKKSMITVSLVVFTIVTLLGFIPANGGTLFGGSFQSTHMTDFMKDILNLAVLLIFLQSTGYLSKPENSWKISEFFVLIMFTLIGMDFMISAGDFVIFYIGLETASIPVAGLAAYDRMKSKSAEAGVKLILLSAMSSGVMLFGLSLIYAATGSIYFADIAQQVKTTPLLILGFIFFLSGIGFKLSIVPFHLWTADVYEGAPINITAFLSVVSKGAAAFILVIILFTVFENINQSWEWILYALVIVTITIGNLFALRQDNIKRFLAFSSITQVGFLLLGVMGNNDIGMTAVVYFMLIYVFTNLAAFGVVEAIYNASGVETISGYRGLYKTNPLLSLVMMLALFSLAGIPPLAGFFGKFFLFTSAASQGYYILVVIAALNATISLYYYLKVVKAMFIDPNDKPIEKFQSSWPMRISLLISAIGIFYVGFASNIFEFIVSLAKDLLH